MKALFRVLAIAMLAAACVFAQERGAGGGPVHLLASNGVKALVEEIQPRAEQTIGHRLTIEFNSTAALKQKIGSGEPLDAAILTTEAIEELSHGGKIDAATRADLARCGIGVGIRAGAPKPDISTKASFKNTLLQAKSITYARDGASSPYLVKMFDGLGISSQIQPKIILAQGSIAATGSVRDGKAELVLTLISEIVPVRGIELVGALPAELQSYVRFSAGVGSRAKERDTARALIEFLAQPGMAQEYRRKGLEPRH